MKCALKLRSMFPLMVFLFQIPNGRLANIQNSVMDAIQNWSNFCVGDLAINLPMSSAKAAAVSWGKLNSLHTHHSKTYDTCARVHHYHQISIYSDFWHLHLDRSLHLRFVYIYVRLVTPGKWKPESMMASQSAAPRHRRQVANDNMKNREILSSTGRTK